ncbi:hypothetical protein OS493_012787 [Desmophyllum pertusum]|uniref:ZP domain-containing protein n=1 Tax=Desmophyllum pertusum TaxID=174260 RepID=A0A9X0CYA9_9CNID|nr:hypothetical protein OS493_012787 [Desmophyllum pertusum]
MKQISLSTLVVVSLFGVLFQGQLADAQSPTINCDNVDSISINIPIPDGDAWSQDDAAEWALNDSTEDSCTPAFSSGEWNYTFPAYTCANATTSGDGNFIHYTFEVSVEPTAGSGSGLEITQKNDHDYTFKCIYDKEHQLTAASFTPRISITGNETDNGVLTFGLELRRDNDDNPVDPDVPIDLTTRYT